MRTVTIRALLALAVLTVGGLETAAAARVATAEQLALMPLPKAALGAAAAALPLHQDSGVVSNKDAAQDATENVTAAGLTRLGRLTGYTLNYSDQGGAALSAGHGLLGVESTVVLYRDPPAAHKGMQFSRDEETNVTALRGSGIAVTVKSVEPPRVGDERWAYSAVLRLKGKPPIYGVDVVFRLGDLIAGVAVSAADPKSSLPLALSLARKLETRIRQVLTGKVTGPPVALPGKAKAGPPPNGPDLAAMALTPKDVGGGKVTQQGYQLDTSLTPVSQYAREISRGLFAFFKQEVSLFHSGTEASFALAVLANALTSPSAMQDGGGGSKGPRIVSYKPTRVKVTGGDEAQAVVAKVRMGDGTTINEGFVIVRIGSAVAFVSVGMPGNVTLPRSVLADLARLTTDRARKGLYKTPVA